MTRRIADYELVRPLGVGNHGRFWLATPPARLALERDRVALKVLDTYADDDAFRRVAQELHLFATVPSQHLVVLHDAGHERGRLFYSMEYHALGSLASPARPLARADVLRAVADAARGAHALHEAGVVHRDVKPANVLLVERGARLSDLGLARVLTPGQSVTGIGPVGAVEYTDPAVLLGDPGSRASDIWSLGLTLHRALTGRSAYDDLEAKSLVAALREVRTSGPRLAPGLGPDEAEVVGSCIAADPADRPSTALELAARLDTLAQAATERP